MDNNIGEIYKITNLINNKIYIGKTKKYYKSSSFGYLKRFDNHINSAFSNSKFNDCPRLYNAIRKYGKDKFKIELICESSLDEIDLMEIKYIKEFNSTDKKIGYNIALGGGGRSTVNISEEIREKISNGQNSKYPINIKPYLKNDKIVGYTVQRRENGKVFRKYFTNSKNSAELNYNLAINWLNSVKNNNINDENINKYNRNDDLPKNIYKLVEKNKIIGYKVNIMKNNIKHNKSFQSINLSLVDLLKKAIEYKNSILNNS
jgi:group I intron endonuclease